MRRENSKKGFWIAYGIFTAVLIAAIVAGAMILSSWLTAFEASQPIHFAEKIYQEYFVEEAWDSALEKAGYENSRWESRDDAVEILKNMKADSVMSFYAAGSSEGFARYNVVLIDPEDLARETGSGQVLEDATAEMKVQGIPSTKIATITLEKSKTEGEWGFHGYEFNKLEIFLEGKESGKITLPAHYSLTVNGLPVEKELVVESVAHRWNQHLPEGVSGITLETYSFRELLKAPQFQVLDANGQEVPLTQKEDGSFEAPIVFAPTDEALANRVLKGMQAYAAYIQNDGTIGEVAKYFDRGSELYRNTAQNPSIWVWDHDGYRFEKEEVKDFYYFDEKTMCCHVSFDHVLRKVGRENYVDPLSMTVFVRKVGNAWSIFATLAE